MIVAAVRNKRNRNEYIHLLPRTRRVARWSGASWSTFLITGWFTGYLTMAMAAVPVVEAQPEQPRPLATKHVKKATAPSQPRTTTTTSVGTAAQGGTGYWLQQLEQLRSELMTLRGQVEEQAFLIKQLQQENEDSRDRYLDLDQRISHPDSTGAPTISEQSGRAMPPVASQAANQTGAEQTATSQALHNQDSDHEKEKQAYQVAFQHIQAKRFDEAQAALKQQLADFPKGHYASNAQYWLGEVQMAQEQYAPAKASFQTVLTNYPNSVKLPDATYKLGRLYDLLGDKQQARDYLEKVINQYPDSAAAKLADTYLRKLP